MIRSLALAFVLVVSASACAKKKSVASPANAAPAEGAAPGGGAADGSEVKDEKKPDDPDDAQKMGADPCDGGE